MLYALHFYFLFLFAETCGLSVSQSPALLFTLFSLKVRARYIQYSIHTYIYIYIYLQLREKERRREWPYQSTGGLWLEERERCGERKRRKREGQEGEPESGGHGEWESVFGLSLLVSSLLLANARGIHCALVIGFVLGNLVTCRFSHSRSFSLSISVCRYIYLGLRLFIPALSHPDGCEAFLASRFVCSRRGRSQRTSPHTHTHASIYTLHTPTDILHTHIHTRNETGRARVYQSISN